MTVVSKKKERPFHPARNAFHMVRSLKNSLFNRMWWKRLGTPLVRFTMRCKKVLPGTTALHANCKVPISDCNSTRRTERRLAKELSKSWARQSLSSGSLASIRVESSSIPMNSSTWEGPRVLELTTGALTDMKRRSNLLKLDRHWKRDGSAMKKSSRIWRTCCSPQLCFKTHSKASDN